MKYDKKLFKKDTNQIFEENLELWREFLKKIKRFEDLQNKTLATELFHQIFVTFLDSEKSKTTTSDTSIVTILWDIVYQVIFSSWSNNLTKELFETTKKAREKEGDEKFFYDSFEKEQNVKNDFKNYTKQLRDSITNVTTAREKKDTQTNLIVEDNFPIIKRDLSQISSLLINAFIDSGIIEIETPEDQKEQNSEEVQFLKGNRLEESHYNVARLNLNPSKLEQKFKEYMNRTEKKEVDKIEKKKAK